MRLSYLGPGCADTKEATKCLARRMKDPSEYDIKGHLTELLEPGEVPRAVPRLPEQSRPKELEAWMDADFNRGSTGGLAVLFGKPCKTSRTVQEPVGLSLGENEFYTCVKRGAALFGVRLLLEDWGLELNLTLRLRTDS